MSESPQADREPASRLLKPSASLRVFRWVFGVMGGLLAALILIVAILMLLAMPIDLSVARERVETLASNALKRPFHIEGPLTLHPTLPPTLQVERIRIGNPAGWPDSDLLKLQRARIRLAVVPLLFDKAQIDEITVEGLDLQLETSAKGEANWLTEHPKTPPDVKAEQVDPVAPSMEIRQLTLRDVRITHKDAVKRERQELTFVEVTGTAKHREPLQLFLEGAIQQLPYRATLQGGSLETLLESDSVWPLDLFIEAVGGSVRLAGTLDKPLQTPGFRLDLDLQVPNTEALKSTLGLSLAAPHSLAVRCRIKGGEGLYSLEELTGNLDELRFEGRFSIDTSGVRPKLIGTMRFPRIDASTFFQAVEDVEASPVRSQPITPEQRASAPVKADNKPKRWDLDAPFLTAAALRLFDADISLSVDRVIGASFSLEDASLGVRIADAELTAPMAVSLAGVPFKGEASLGSAAGVPGIRVSLRALGSEIGELAKLLVEAEGIEGRFEYAKLEFSAQGETLRALAESTAMSFSLSDAVLSYGHDTGGQPVEFMINRMEMDFPASQDSGITARGALLGEPFSLQIRGGSFLDKFVHGQWPIELEAAGSGARLRVNGVIVPAGDTLVEFELAGEPLGKLTHWIGFSPDATAAYRVAGELSATDAAIIVLVKEGRLADTHFSGKLGIRQENGDRVTLIGLEADSVDLDRLMELLAEPDKPDEPRETKRQYAIDVPILPNGIEIFDSDLELSIKRLGLKPVDIRRLKVSSRIRGGYVEQAPFQMGIADALFRGRLGADLRTDLPSISFDLESNSLDIGALLEHLGLAEGLGLTTERLNVSAMLKGTTTRDMLSRSELTAVLQGGIWRVGQSRLKETLDIVIGKGTITARRDEPTTLRLDANIDGIPLLMKLRTSSLASFSKSKERIRMDADIKVANADMRLSGRAPLPIKTDNLQFKLSIKGSQFSDFDDLLDASLPPWGAYDLEGEFGSRKSGYYVRDMRLVVGESILKGNLEFDGTTLPPRMNLDLTANSIQLDDFDTGSWSARGSEQGTATPTDGRAASVDRARALLSPGVMRSLDAKLRVRVAEILSGKDELGRGRLVATVERGRLSVDPLALEIPGGSVDLAFALEPTDKDVAFSTRANIERLDYGYLARRIDPESTVGGMISLDVDISTRGPGMATLMNDSIGHIDFAIWPEGIDASIFDLWATNLLIQALPLLDSGTTSQVNCLVARFQLKDGIMEPSAVLVDTTRVQATAKGKIDFRSREVDLQLVPRSKRPQMFSAETPLQVQGAFSDFSVDASPGALLGTTIRIITSPVVVPFQWVFTKRPPADGTAACQRVWGRTPQEDRSMSTETSDL